MTSACTSGVLALEVSVPLSLRLAGGAAAPLQPLPGVDAARAEGPAAARTSRLAHLLPAFGEDGDGGLASPNSRYGIEDILLLSIREHPEVAARRADLAAAQAGEGAARWQYFPALSVQHQQKDQGDNATVVALQQPLWAAGRIDAGLDAASSRVRSADSAIDESQYLLALRALSAWQAWLVAHKRGRILERGVALLGFYGDSVAGRIRSGISPAVDGELVAARITQLRGDMAAAHATERAALAQLSQIAGRSLTPDQLKRSASTGELPAFDRLAKQAQARSAGLKRAEAEVEAAQHDVVQQRAALWPTVGLRAEYQHGDSTLPGNSARVMVVFDYAPGAGLSARAAVDAAAARAVGLRDSLEVARRDIVARVAADYEEWQASRNRLDDAGRTVAAAVEVLVSYDRLFIAGKRSWLDVLNAARELTQAEGARAEVEVLQAATYHRLRLHAGEFSWQQGGRS